MSQTSNMPAGDRAVAFLVYRLGAEVGRFRQVVEEHYLGAGDDLGHGEQESVGMPEEIRECLGRMCGYASELAEGHVSSYPDVLRISAVAQAYARQVEEHWLDEDHRMRLATREAKLAVSHPALERQWDAEALAGPLLGEVDPIV